MFLTVVAPSPSESRSSPQRRKPSPFARMTAAISASHSSRRRLDQRIEHRLQIERRAADHLEHVGGRGLLLQRFREVAGLRLHLVEQPHVLDRDHGLVGEGLQQLDVMVGEGAGLLSRDHDQADRRSLAHQRREQRCCGNRAPATMPSCRDRVGFGVRLLNDLAALAPARRTANRRPGAGMRPSAPCPRPG